MKGEDLFDHMIAMRHRNFSKSPKLMREHKISDHHHVISPKKGFPKHQQDFMNIDYANIVERRIMDDVGDSVNLKQAAKARLDNLGHVKSHSQWANDPRRLERMRDKAELALSVGLVKSRQKAAVDDKAEKERADLAPILIAALNMFKKNETGKRTFTKAHILAITIIVFRETVDRSAKKIDLMDQLKMLHLKDTEGKIDRALALPPPLPPLPPPAPAPAIEANETAPPAAAAAGTGANGNAFWLYHRCELARASLGTPLSALQLSLVVLKSLKKMAREREDYYDADGDNDNGLYEKFFQALSGDVLGTESRDVPFVIDLAERARQMMADEDLTEDALKRVAP